MERFKFSFSIIWASLISKKQFTIITLFTLILCFFLPITAFAMFFQMQTFEEVTPIIKNKSISEVTTKIIVKQEDKINEQLLSTNEQIENVFFTCNDYTALSYGGEKKVSFVAAYSKNFFELSNTKLTEGRMPTKEEIESNAKVCLASINFIRYYPNLKVGESISLYGETFEVIGIVVYSFKGAFFIPYGIITEFISEEQEIQMDYEVFIQTDQPILKEDLEKNFKKQKLPVNDFLLMEDSSERQAEFNNKVYIKYASVIVPILIFSLISVVLVIVGKMRENAYLTGVKQALGATKLSIFLDVFLENAILTMIAILIDWVLVKKFEVFIALNASSLQLDFMTFFVSAMFGLIICSLVTIIALMFTLQKSVAIIMREKI